MWTRVLDTFLAHMIQRGELTVTLADGQTRRYGDASLGPSVAIAFHDEALPRKIVMSPDLAAGEAYMDERLTIENDDLRGFLDLTVFNMSLTGEPWYRTPMAWARNAGRFLQQFNPAARSRANVAHHYDLSGELYDLFLDTDRQYSCAYFRDPDMSLEAAQEAKKHHIARKLMIEPGMRVLDIGCGWGGMGLTLARDYGADVTGVTLSTEQHAMANTRAQKAGLSDRARFEMIDYRDVQGRFDRIVSVGMFEHVGVPHYNTYFRSVHDLLTSDGVALIHTIGRTEPPGTTSPWLRKYIFPGGYVPAMSETMRAVEKQELIATDVEIWRLHYAETLKHWHARFVENEDKARALYDERFCRMWRFYLLACEMMFRHAAQVVFQFQLTRDRYAVPQTRDYIYTPKEGDTTTQEAAE